MPSSVPLQLDIAFMKHKQLRPLGLFEDWRHADRTAGAVARRQRVIRYIGRSEHC
jgi:hypothetical protein